MFYLLRWLGLVLIGLLIYFQTFHFGFIFDDHFFIIDNPYIRNFNHIHWIWHTFPMTRLVGMYSFALNYHFNQFHPQGYHIFNFIVHLAGVGLVWALARLLFKITKWLPPEDRLNQDLPFMIAMLFLVHPCQTQAVTYISQRFESMAAVFYLGTVHCFLSARLSVDRRRKIILFGLSGLLAILGIMTKEVVITVPLMILAAEWILFSKNENKKLYIVLAAGGIFLYLLFSRLVHTDLRVFFRTIPSESHDGDVLTPGRYFLTQMRVFLTFLRILVFPIHQNLDYDYPVSIGPLAPPLTLAGLCTIGSIVVLIVKLRRQFTLIAFGLAWTLITFSINLAPRANVIFEHKLYLISFGFFLMLVTALSILVKDRRALMGILWFMVMALAVVSFDRNKVWGNEFILWNDTVQKSPHKARPLNNRGLAYYNQGHFSQAMADYNRAIEINPDYIEAYSNRGLLYYTQGRFSLSILDFNKAIAKNPNHAEIYSNRGLAYYREGNIAQALTDYNKAIEINSDYAQGYSNRGLLYLTQGRFVQSIADYNDAIEKNPNDTDTYGNLSNRGLAYYNLGNFFRAMSDYNKAIDMNPNYAAVYSNRGLLYCNQGNFTQSLSDYNKALEINPNYVEVYANRGYVYDKQGRYAKALSDLNKAIEINPKYADAYINRGNVHLHQNELAQAVSDYSKAIGINPQYALAYNNRAVAYYRLKEYDNSRSDVRRAKELGDVVNAELIRLLSKETGIK
ncbi:MAG: tetratricopeptide repeat protein [Candidatus Omnitrophica bacterium]|nr:tetratricopeptide repeat protein [Candidatus Omnitrophota bacterium]